LSVLYLYQLEVIEEGRVNGKQVNVFFDVCMQIVEELGELREVVPYPCFLLVSLAEQALFGNKQG
jgi:hypothetical protein